MNREFNEFAGKIVESTEFRKKETAYRKQLMSTQERLANYAFAPLMVAFAVGTILKIKKSPSLQAHFQSLTGDGSSGLIYLDPVSKKRYENAEIVCELSKVIAENHPVLKKPILARSKAAEAATRALRECQDHRAILPSLKKGRF